MKRQLTLVMLTLMTMAMSVLLSSGCAYRRADRSLVQPLALSKKLFVGEWYFMKTVYEAPADSQSFTGEVGWPLGNKIRWEVTERYLYAFNAAPNIRNTNSEVTPLAAWMIQKHFDIKPRLNYSTGEPSNLIVEESTDGLPWYQRKYMRVSWDQVVISDWTDIYGTYMQMVGYFFVANTYVPPENFEVSEKSDYFSYTVDHIITSHPIIEYYNAAQYEIPMSSHRVKFRYSFRKIGESTFTPREYSDNMVDKFGVYRTGVITYHPHRGIKDWSYKYFANIHNIANKEEIAQGTKKPTKITYYLSPEWPEDLAKVVKEVAASWNGAFQYALRRPGETCFEILPNNHGLPAGQSRKIGDARYNFLWWTNNYQQSSPLGFGPSFADPETGEVIAGHAAIYGASYRPYVNSIMNLYDMVDGRYTDTDIANGVSYFNTVNLLNGFDRVMVSTNQTRETASGSGFVAPNLGKLGSASSLRSRLLDVGFISKMKGLQRLDNSSITAHMAKLDSFPDLKARLMNDELAQLSFPNVDVAEILSSDKKEVKNMLQEYQPVELMKPLNMQKWMDKFLAPSRKTMFKPEYADAALIRFVEFHAKKKTPREEVRKRIAEFVLISTITHEIGHTFGLMHNFSSSSDEFNYRNGYWDIKEGKQAQCKDCPEDYNHEFFYRIGSVMDYPGEQYDTALGLGKTDHAAIAFIYNNLVEKAVKDPREQGELVKWDETIEKRHQDPNDTFKLRAFRNCTDYSVGLDSLCNRWDSGAKADGIVQNIIANYDRTYVLSYFRRGRRFFEPYYGYYRNILRFQIITGFYQDWIYKTITDPSYKNTPDFEDKFKAVQRGFQFLTRVVTTPSVGDYSKDDQYNIWMTRPVSEDITAPQFSVKLGVGRFMFARWQEGYMGLADNRYIRSGTWIDKLYATLFLTTRSLGFLNNYNDWIYSSFYDLFTEDSLNLFSQGITGVWNSKSELLFKKEIQCKSNDDCDINDTCNASGVCSKAYPIEPGWHPILQIYTMMFSLASVNHPYSDTTFSDYLRVATAGNGKSWTPPAGAQTISFTNSLGTRTYFAVQTKDEKSISWKLIERAQLIAGQLKLLRESTTNINRTIIERKESELENIETTLTLIQQYVSVFAR